MWLFLDRGLKIIRKNQFSREKRIHNSNIGRLEKGDIFVKLDGPSRTNRRADTTIKIYILNKKMTGWVDWTFAQMCRNCKNIS